MILLDLSHTSHSKAQTGIQRVARSLAREMGPRARPVCFDPYEDSWRPLTARETRTLSATSAGWQRRAHWPLPSRIRGRIRKYLRQNLLRNHNGDSLVLKGDSLFAPEIFSPRVARAYGGLFEAVPGPRAAYFYDAIALKLPELAPASVVARFPGYLQELLRFDGVAAISEESRDALADYWAWLGATNTPVTIAIPLGADPPVAPIVPNVLGRPARPVVLYVSSVEGRKNHLALLEACESLWARNLDFELHLIGLPRPETAQPALDRVAALKQAGRPLRYDGAVDDREVEAAHAAATFTVYPSLMEGSGLPVRESLARGKPCICSAYGALGEAARDGGCLTLPSLGPAAIAAAIERLLNSPEERAALTAAARARPIRTWADVARDIETWMAGLKRR